MNIAILIGVSKYKHAAPLPACVADVEQMRRVLQATKKYDDICCLTDQTNSNTLKDALRAFFSKHQSDNGINEAFVYFSGHGVYHTDALLCCSDFDPNRPSTTSIANEELDDLLRSISPNVAVKVIDACQSGSPYIKDANAGFEKALRTSRLNSFICMASSRLDQSSYATSEASAFTAKWIDSALYKTEGTILYRDIQASLADAFVNTPEQTPFFVSQGSGLEEFSIVTEEIRRLAVGRNKGIVNIAPEDQLGDILAAEIAKLDEQYIAQDLACKCIAEAGDKLEKQPISEPLVSRFYDKNVVFIPKLGQLPRARTVAEFAQEQGWAKNYFVRVTTEEVRVKVPKDPFSSIFRAGLSRRLKDDEYEIELRSRPSSIESTQSLPFEVAEITFNAKNHPSLRAFVLYIGIVHSLTEVMVLSALVRLQQKGWEQRSPELSEIQWKYQNYLWKDLSNNTIILWDEAMKQGLAAIRSYLESLASITEAVSDSTTEEQQDSSGDNT